MLVLAIDTALAGGGVALARDGELLAEVFWQVGATHSRLLLPAVENLLELAGESRESLEGVAVCAGPGYFTGLRIGLASAQGLALGLGIMASPVSSLRLLALGAACHQGVIWAVADARRGLVYAAPFRSGPAGLQRLAPDAAMAPERLAAAIEPPALLLGDGARLYAAQLAGSGATLAPEAFDRPRPGNLALLGARRLSEGRGVLPQSLAARYCRPSDAEVRFGLPLDEYNLVS